MTEIKANELMLLERRGWEALSRGQGKQFYGSLLADDAIVIVPGVVMDKEQTLASWDGVAPWQWYDLIDRTVVHLVDTALVTYDAVARRGSDPPYRATVSTMYAKRGQRWRLVLHQQTPWA